ncbi:hypothetical protein D9M68_758910 [compost metagenome]
MTGAVDRAVGVFQELVEVHGVAQPRAQQADRVRFIGVAVVLGDEDGGQVQRDVAAVLRRVTTALAVGLPGHSRVADRNQPFRAERLVEDQFQAAAACADDVELQGSQQRLHAWLVVVAQTVVVQRAEAVHQVVGRSHHPDVHGACGVVAGDAEPGVGGQGHHAVRRRTEQTVLPHQRADDLVDVGAVADVVDRVGDVAIQRVADRLALIEIGTRAFSFGLSGEVFRRQDDIGAGRCEPGALAIRGASTFLRRHLLFCISAFTDLQKIILCATR